MHSDRPLFVSYSSSDREMARAVEAMLSAPPLGRSVWRDERSIERDWSAEIARALAESEAIVLVWSANAAASNWVRHEWLTARALQKPIMPVLIDATPLPPPLENLHAVMIIDGRLDATVAANRLRAVLTAPPAYDFTIRPRGLVMPFTPNPNFVGRGRDLLSLYLSLIGQLNKLGTRAVSLVGMGGVGKTQLAIEFVYRFGFAFGGVHWIDAAHADGWLERFVSLARDDLHLSPGGTAEPSDHEWIRLLRAHCAEHPDLLLVMDNVIDPEQLADDTILLGVAPVDLGCSLLYTTRRRFELPGVSMQAVDILGEAAAYELLTARRKPEGDQESGHAHAICAALGFLPLALVLASAYVARYVDITFGDYRHSLAESRLDTIDVQRLSSSQLATRHDAAVRLTLQNQAQALIDPSARLVFRIAGLMREGELLPIGRLGLLAGLRQSPRALARPLDDARFELQDLSLAETAEGGSALRVHPLVHDFARSLVDDPTAERAAAAARLAATYADPGAMEHEYAQRGMDGIIGDVALGLEWSRGATRDELAVLVELLDSESGTLHRFPHHQYPALFLQQLANRATLTGTQDFSNRAGAHLVATGRAHFSQLWRTQTSSRALVRTIVGSRSWMTKAAISPSGKRLVTVAQSGYEGAGVIGVWDMATGRLVEEIDAGDTVTGLCFTDDDDHIVTSGSSGELRLRNLATRQIVRAARGGGAGFGALALTPDGRTAVTGGEEQALLAWDLTRWSGPRVVGTTGQGADVIAITPAGTAAVVGGYGAPPGGSLLDERGFLELWHLETGERRQVVQAHRFVIDVVLVRDGLVLTAGRDGWVRFWDAESLAAKGELQIAEPGAGTLLPDGRAAFASGRDVAIVDVGNHSIVQTLRGHTGIILSLAVSRDGTRLVSAAADGTARVWRLDRGGRTDRSRQSGHGAAVRTGLALESVAVTGDMKGGLRLWALDKGELLAEHRQWMGPRGDALSVRGGRLVLTSSSELEGGSILALNVQDRTEETLSSTAGRVSFLQLDRDERVLLVGDTEQVRVYDADLLAGGPRTFRRALKAPPGDDYFDAAAMTPDGALLAAATSNVFGGANTLVLYDLGSGEIVTQTTRLDSDVGSLAITGDGAHIAFTARSGVLGVWEPLSKGTPRIVGRGLGGAAKLLLLDDGRHLVTAADAVSLWDIETGVLLRQLGNHLGVWHLSGAGPGRILTACEDWTVRLWDLEAGAELATLALDGEASLATLSLDARVFICADDAGDVYAFRLVLPKDP